MDHKQFGSMLSIVARNQTRQTDQSLELRRLFKLTHHLKQLYEAVAKPPQWTQAGKFKEKRTPSGTSILLCLGLVFSHNHVLAESNENRLFAYVTNQNSNTISLYRVNTRTGVPTLASSLPGGGGEPTSISIPPNGKFAYVTNCVPLPASSFVSTYTIDAAGGGLTQVPGSTITTLKCPTAGLIPPNGKTLYIANDLPTPSLSKVSAYAINHNTGALTAIPGSPFAAGTNTNLVSIDPAGRFLFAGGNNVLVYSINRATGGLVPVPGSPFASASGDAIVGGVDPTGRFLYVSNPGSNVVSGYKLDPFTGSLTPIPGSPFLAGSNPYGISIEPTGKFLYVANQLSNNISAYRIDSHTGALSALPGSPYPAGNGPYFGSVDPEGRFLYFVNINSNNMSAFTINANTGALTSIPGSPFATGGGPNWITFYRADSEHDDEEGH